MGKVAGKKEWWEQLGVYDVSGMVQRLKLKELFIQRFLEAQKYKEGIRSAQEMKHGTEWVQYALHHSAGDHSQIWAF